MRLHFKINLIYSNGFYNLQRCHHNAQNTNQQTLLMRPLSKIIIQWRSLVKIRWVGVKHQVRSDTFDLFILMNREMTEVKCLMPVHNMPSSR